MSVEFTCQYCGHEHSSKGCPQCANGEPYHLTRCLSNGPVLKLEVDALRAGSEAKKEKA